MILFIKFSGGMGISYQGSVDLSTLPCDLLEKVQTELSEENISKTIKGKKDRYMSDFVTYEFQYENSGKKVTIDESQASEQLLELIDSLRPYLHLEAK